MLDNIFTVGLNLLAFILPVSIAATNIVFFPLAALWLLAAKWTFPKWRPVWGWPEKFFLVYLAASLLSAALSVNPAHSFLVIWKKDFYILIMVVLVALVREEKSCARLLRLFMAGALLTAVVGLIQCAVGVNATDITGGYFLYLPPRLAHWPRPILNALAMLNGRVLGTRGHPLAYAECLLFNWAFAICFLLSSSRPRAWAGWTGYLILIGGGLLVSQSRGPWIAAAVIAFLAMVTSNTRKSWLLLGLCALFMAIFATVPVLRDRAVSILDRSHSSNIERLHMWRAGLEMWKSHPLLGIGPGSVKAVSLQYQTPHEQVGGSWGHLHSIYINCLAERGALGLLTFFLFIGALCRDLWRGLRKSSGDPWREAVFRASLLGVLGFFIGGLTEAVYNTAVVMMTFYFTVGLALALARHDRHA
jgi:O-antigen ligase